MGLTLPYPTYSAFTAATVHSSTAHNIPHEGLLSNDIAIKEYLDALSLQVANIPQGRIVSTIIKQSSGPAAGWTWTYTGSYVPLFITVLVSVYGSSSAARRSQFRYLNSSGSVIKPGYTDLVAGNPQSGNDDGISNHLSWAFNCTIPFIVGAKSIQFKDYYFNSLYFDYRVHWSVMTLTEHQIPRWSEWGY